MHRLSMYPPLAVAWCSWAYTSGANLGWEGLQRQCLHAWIYQAGQSCLWRRKI